MIIKIGAKVIKTRVGVVQSQRLGSFFFLHYFYDTEKENCLTRYNFGTVISVHHYKYGHSISYPLQPV